MKTTLNNVCRAGAPPAVVGIGWVASGALALQLLAATLAYAQGPLTPPGPPGPTMLTLNQVEPRTPITNLPYSITVPGSYYITTNLTGVSGFPGITILTNDVTVDLSGFTLQGVVGSGPAISVPTMERNLAIRNGALDGWGMRGTNAYNSLFERLRESNSGGAGLLAGSNCVVSVCSVSVNFTVGIGVGNNCTVKDCTVSGTSGFGIQTANGCVVVDCTVSGNSSDGINVGNGTGVRGCTSYQNGNNGVTAANNCTVKDCTASDNDFDGFAVLNYCSVISCNASGNGDNGIEVFNYCSVTSCNASGNNTLSAYGIWVNGVQNLIGGNTCSSNAYGIVINGGRNRIDGNTVGNNSVYGVYPFSLGVTNAIVRNSVSGNGLNYFNFSGNNDYAPTGTPSTATSPWANF
jgi:parallel beta-helix repeat protein